MPDTASPLPAPVGAYAGLISCKPAAARSGDTRQASKTKRLPCPSRACGTVAASAETPLLQPRPQPAPARCANRVVTTRRQPVVTTRALPQRTSVLPGLSQVTTPRDGLPGASRPRTVQRGLHPPAPRGPCQPWRQPAHPEPWGNGSPDGSPSRRKRHRRQCRVPRRPAVTRHETGVVSRVPRGSRNAKAFGTDRNTDQTDHTPATTNPNRSRGSRPTRRRRPTAVTECET